MSLIEKVHSDQRIQKRGESFHHGLRGDGSALRLVKTSC
jgi:hypothetical protein